MAEVTIALPKGRLAELSLALLEKCGVDCTELKESGRKLTFSEPTGVFKFLLVKPGDVPTYIAHGVADMGIAGKDTLMEANLPLYEMLDLGFARCRLAVAGYPERENAVTVGALRVATKYPNIAARWYRQKGVHAEIIKLNGSIEIAPILGLSDVILDVVESGRTLKENGLAVLEEITDVSARVVVNRISLKTKSGVIRPLIEKMRENLASLH